jgi:DNA-binding NtrC family response regulator
MTLTPSVYSKRDSAANTLVLCVDDDAAILEITKAILERKGFSVITASDWRHAIVVIESHPVDLVILDYEMPEMKGHEVAVIIRRVDAEVPLILHTGATNVPEVAIAATDAVIQKGIDTASLVAAIESLVMKSRPKTKSTPASWTAKLNSP